MKTKDETSKQQDQEDRETSEKIPVFRSWDPIKYPGDPKMSINNPCRDQYAS